MDISYYFRRGRCFFDDDDDDDTKETASPLRESLSLSFTLALSSIMTAMETFSSFSSRNVRDTFPERRHRTTRMKISPFSPFCRPRSTRRGKRDKTQSSSSSSSSSLPGTIPHATQSTRGHIRGKRRDYIFHVKEDSVRCNSMKRGESNKRSDVKASSTNSSHHRLRTTKTMHTDGQRKQRRTRLRGRGTLVCASSSVSSSKGDNFAIPLPTIVSILAVMLAAFFHLLGFTATGPITPELVKHFDIPGSKIGYLTSAYPLGMFFALFLWPRLSDLPMVGRKKVITLSLLGVGTFLLAQAKCVSLGYSFETFLILRVLAGCCAGASPVIKAYLADIGSSVSASMRAASKKATREAATTDKADMNANNNNNNNAIAAKRYENGAFTARLMGWREACCTLAFVVGPTVGGIICSGLSLSATIAFTGYASILASILVFVLVVEPTSAQTINVVADGSTEKSKNEGGGSSNDANANVDALYDSQNLSCPLGVSLVAAVGTICVTSFLYNAGQSTFDSFFPLVISRTVGMGPTMIGATLTSLSLVSLSISTLLFAPIFKFFGLTKTCGIGLALVAIGLAMIGVSTTAFTTGLGAFFYVCGVPLFTPSIPILLMQCVPTTSRGAVMGFDSAINSSARIITPVLLGSVFAASRGKAFLCAATCVGAAFVIVVIRSFVVFRETRVKYFPSRNQ